MVLQVKDKRGLPALMQSHSVIQFARFSLVGLSGFVIDAGLLYYLTSSSPFWKTHLVIANAISFTCAVVNNFTWHNLWTFRDHPSVESTDDDLFQEGEINNKNSRNVFGKSHRFLLFFLISVVGLCLNTKILVTIYYQQSVQHIFGIHAILFAKVIATGVVWFWNFGANKFLTFRKG